MSNTTECKSPCYNEEYMVNGTGTAEWTECKSSEPSVMYVSSGTYSFCHNGSGVVFEGGVFAFPTGNKTVCGCND